MRILIDSGDYRCSNMGDLAMLQVAVTRLNRMFPTATIQTITSNPTVIADQVPQSSTVPQSGLQAWFAERYLLGRLHQALPESASREIGRIKSSLRRRWPSLVESMMKAKMGLTGSKDDSALEFLEAFHDADFIVMCGQGGINDVFYKHALAVLDFLDMAIRSAKPTAIFSQGIGPIRNQVLLNKATSVLSRLGFIAVREGQSSTALLRSMKIKPEKIVNTGDDAIELAYDARPEKLGQAIGINVRIAEYTAISAESVNRMRSVFQQLASRYAATLLPVPISRYPDCKDARDIQQLLSGINNFADNGRELDTPIKVIAQVGRCRVVVTVAYHSAVFALSQGIPVVALANSEYCIDKFQGLLYQFGTGIEIVFLDSPTLAEDIITAFEKAWDSAEQTRDWLLEASARQIKTGIAAYHKAVELLPYRKVVA